MPTQKIREITITESKGAFSLLKNTPDSKKYDFSGISALRQILSNEKAKILHTIKLSNPSSVYDLSKKLGRSFKSVSDDLKVLERFGFVHLIKENTKKRIRHKPVIDANTITIHFKI